MPPKERTLTEIRDVDGATYFLDTAWCTASASFDLFLTDGAEIWQTQVGEEEIEKFPTIENETITMEGWVSETKAAFNGELPERYEFLVHKTRRHAPVEFSWKMIAEAGLKFELGSVRMVPCVGGSLGKTIDFFLRRCMALQVVRSHIHQKLSPTKNFILPFARVVPSFLVGTGEKGNAGAGSRGV
eukprot:m.235718 g.235718  ORF g.235718 m.235718 type:complete len:186 (-) comp22484_c4_seq5:666-1223(-)